MAEYDLSDRELHIDADDWMAAERRNVEAERDQSAKIEDAPAQAEPTMQAPRVIGTDGSQRLICLREDWAMYQHADRIDTTIYSDGGAHLYFIPARGKRIEVYLRREELHALVAASDTFMSEYKAEQARRKQTPDDIPF